MKQNDSSKPLVQLNKKESMDKEFETNKERLETPEDVFYHSCEIVRRMGLKPPELDLMATNENTKCIDFIDKKTDFFTFDFNRDEIAIPESTWINAPHKQYSKVVPRLHELYNQYGFTIVCLMPSNNERTNYYKRYIERYRFEAVNDWHIYTFPVNIRIAFELDGKPATDKKGKPDVAHNGYKFVIWVGKSHQRNFREKLKDCYEWYFDELFNENEDK